MCVKNKSDTPYCGRIVVGEERKLEKKHVIFQALFDKVIPYYYGTGQLRSRKRDFLSTIFVSDVSENLQTIHFS